MRMRYIGSGCAVLTRVCRRKYLDRGALVDYDALVIIDNVRYGLCSYLTIIVQLLA